MGFHLLCGENKYLKGKNIPKRQNIDLQLNLQFFFVTIRLN